MKILIYLILVFNVFIISNCSSNDNRISLIEKIIRNPNSLKYVCSESSNEYKTDLSSKFCEKVFINALIQQFEQLKGNYKLIITFNSLDNISKEKISEVHISDVDEKMLIKFIFKRKNDDWVLINILVL